MADKYLSALAPKITAKAVETTNAEAAAKKTNALLDVPSVENNTVASWVLSPSSARNTVKNIVR